MSDRKETNPPHTDAKQGRGRKILDLYYKQKPLFPREDLVEISKRRADYQEGKVKNGEIPSIEIPDYVDGDKLLHRIDLDLGYHEEGKKLKGLAYFSIQQLLETGASNPIRSFETDASNAYPLFSSEDLQNFEGMRKDSYQNWTQSSTRVSVQETFGNMDSQKLKRITKIIALGNGSLWHEFRSQNTVAGKHVVAQHAVIQDIREIIKTKTSSDHKIDCYAQESKYTPADEKVLDEFGIELLEDPNGLLKIDEETLVFSMNPDFPLLQIIADISKPPAMIFGGEIDRSATLASYYNAHGVLVANPTSPRVQSLIQNYQEHVIDDPEGHFEREATRLYVLN